MIKKIRALDDRAKMYALLAALSLGAVIIGASAAILIPKQPASMIATVIACLVFDALFIWIIFGDRFA